MFPHSFDSLADSDRYQVIRSMPAGNTYSIMMAKACLEGEQMGMGDQTDFMALSLSSSDYVGHQFAPNSMETEDLYLRLDREIAGLLNYLDKQYGRNNYLFFLTADHGGAHNAEFLADKDVPAGVFYVNTTADLNASLKTQFGKDSIVNGIVNYQVFLNNKLIAAEKLDRDKIKQAICDWMGKRPEVAYVMDMENMDRTPVPEPIRSMAINGYNRARSGAIQLVLNPGWYDNGGKTTGMTHGSWNPYDTHIPLLWYGWHIPKGETDRQINMTDISATLAALLHIQAPNGCIGKPIVEVTAKPLMP